MERHPAAAAEEAARRQAEEKPCVLNGIFGNPRTGAPWRDMPERYGPCTTAYNRFNRWRKAGIWDRLMDAIVKRTTATCR